MKRDLTKKIYIPATSRLDWREYRSRLIRVRCPVLSYLDFYCRTIFPECAGTEVYAHLSPQTHIVVTYGMWYIYIYIYTYEYMYT